MENILDRIKAYISSKGISIRQLERNIGASNGVLSTAIKKGTDISSKWLSKIVELDSTLNARWLLTGIGDMNKSNVQEPGERYHKKQGCKECIEKERVIKAQQSTIDSQQKTIDTQTDFINTLKTITPSKGAEKKSALTNK